MKVEISVLVSLGTGTKMSELRQTVGEGKIGHVHIMKACGGSGSIAALILNLATGWR
jgi:hypothetical protein